MSTEAAPAVDAVPAKKSRKKLLLIIAAVVVLAGGGAGAYFMLGSKPAAPAAAGEEAASEASASAEHGGGHDGSQAKAETSDYVSLSPSFTVNLNDEEAMRFLQVDVEVLAPKTATQEAIRATTPMIRNRLVLLFSSQRYHELLTRDGKEKLQKQALDEINKVLTERKKPLATAVVFTSFVMQ